MVESVRRSTRVVGTELMRLNHEKIMKNMEQRNDKEQGLCINSMIGNKEAGIRVSIFKVLVFDIDISVYGIKSNQEGRFPCGVLR